MGWTTGALEFKSWCCQEYSLLYNVQTGSGDHPAPYPIGIDGYFPMTKADEE
jgi:hypothetical protein